MIETIYNAIIPTIANEPNNFKLSAPIALEVIRKLLLHSDLIENSHHSMKGTEPLKIAGYLTYWISKLKPIQILESDPEKNEILINEYLALSVAIVYIYESANIFILSQKMIDDLKYTLRYRTLTVRTLPLIYEAYLTGIKDKK